MDAVATPTEVRMVWVGKQSEALLDTTPYLDIEGAIRSSKTTIGLWKVVNACLAFPGLRALVARWIEDDAHAILRPLLRFILEQAGVEAHWVGDEHRFDLPRYGSWIYVRGLRPSQDTSKFSKFRGLTLGMALVDQAEEMDVEYYMELKGRLSQVGYPRQLILTPNPSGHDHWLSREFPDEESGAPPKPAHKMIRLSIYDNAHNLDPSYISGLERDWQPGHPMRRRLLEGKRGLNVAGKPVYGGYFDRPRHIRPVALDPDAALIEAIDFGHHHPCVLWAQFLPWGALHWLGGVLGEDCYLEDFAPLISQYRAGWFPQALDILTCCDPAGSHANSQGTRRSGVDVLREHQMAPRWVASSNSPEARDYAIQSIAGYMRRRTQRGEAFAMDPSRWRIVSARESRFASFALDAVESGYVYDARVRRTPGGRSMIVPLKDGYYEHVMNCAEYAVQNFGPARPTVTDERKYQTEMERRRGARDYDPDDPRPYRVSRRGTNHFLPVRPE